MKRQQLTSFYLEALLLILVFVAMILVLTGVFGVSRAQSAKADRLSRAVTLAANAAEAAAAADSLEQAALLLDEGVNVRIIDGQLEGLYLSDGSPCTEGREALRLTVSPDGSDETAALVTYRIAVCVPGGDTPPYTLEHACFRKVAAA